MRWKIEVTNQFGAWWEELDADDHAAIRAAVASLAERGTALGPPLVHPVPQSRYSEMRELRVAGGDLRILFAFAPNNVATLLIGGEEGYTVISDRALDLPERMEFSDLHDATDDDD